MVKSAKRKALPSRIKYERSHPVVSFRVSRDIYDELQRVKEAGGMSFTDILKLGMGKAERDNKKAARIRLQASHEGYRKGFDEAESKYKVTYPCRTCGQLINIMHQNEKEAVSRLMYNAGWSHQHCP